MVRMTLIPSREWIEQNPDERKNIHTNLPDSIEKENIFNKININVEYTVKDIYTLFEKTYPQTFKDLDEQYNNVNNTTTINDSEKFYAVSEKITNLKQRYNSNSIYHIFIISIFQFFNTCI